MLPTSMKPNRWSLLTSQTRRSRNSLTYSATSRREEVYPYTGQKSIPSVTSPICKSWKEKSGFVWLALLAPFSFLMSSSTVSRDEEAPYGSGQDIRRTDVGEPCRPQGIRTTCEGSLREVLQSGGYDVPKLSIMCKI